MIPNSRGEPPPPPLPPPTHMDDIAAGSDPGWAWENSRRASMSIEARGSVGSDSSGPQGWRIKQERDDGLQRPDYIRRGSSQVTIKPAPEVNSKYDFSRHHDEGYYSLSAGSSANHQSVFTFFSSHPILRRSTRETMQMERGGQREIGASEMVALPPFPSPPRSPSGKKRKRVVNENQNNR